MLAFIDVNLERNRFFGLVEAGRRNRSEVDISLRTVGVLQVFETFRDLLAVKDISVFYREQIPQGFCIRLRLGSLEGDGSEPVALAFFDRHGDVHGFTGAMLEQRHVKSLVPSVANNGLWLAYVGFEISPILQIFAYQFHIIIELGSVISFGKNVFQEN